MPLSGIPQSNASLDEQLLALSATALSVFRVAMQVSPSHFNPSEVLIVQALCVGQLQNTPYTAASIEELTGLPRSTVRRILKDFIERGIVERVSVGNKAQYTFAPDFGSTESKRWFVDNVNQYIRQISRGQNGTTQV